MPRAERLKLSSLPPCVKGGPWARRKETRHTCGIVFGRKSPRSNTVRTAAHLFVYMSGRASSHTGDVRQRDSRLPERQARGRQERQHHSRQRPDSVCTDRPWEQKYHKQCSWPDLRSESTPAKGDSYRGASGVAPSPGDRVASATRQRSETNEHRRRESEQARHLLASAKQYNLEKNAWQARRKVWIESRCPKHLVPLAKNIVVPQEHWEDSWDQLNDLLAEGDFDELLPQIEGFDQSTRRKITQRLSWYLDGHCRFDQINSDNCIWRNGRFLHSPSEPGQLDWHRRGKKTRRGELCYNNDLPRSESPTPEQIARGERYPKHAPDSYAGSVERGLPPFKLGDFVAKAIEEKAVRRVQGQNRDPVKPLVLIKVADEEPFHNHIKGGPPKVSSDLSTTSFRPAFRRNRTPEGTIRKEDCQQFGGEERELYLRSESRPGSTGSAWLCVEEASGSRNSSEGADVNWPEYSRFAKSCEELDKKIEVKAKQFGDEVGNELREKLLVRKALTTDSSDSSSADADDIDYGLLPERGSLFRSAAASGRVSFYSYTSRDSSRDPKASTTSRPSLHEVYTSS